ncbi:substrate-binding domain-containing protein [Streptosporangium soli]|nr:hypothetical protein [Streptosporangium sp. KLBMP 9127]
MPTASGWPDAPDRYPSDLTDAQWELIEKLRKDPLLSKIPAVERDSVYLLPDTKPLGTAANPTPLSISWVLEDYVKALAEAADKVK